MSRKKNQRMKAIELNPTGAANRYPSSWVIDNTHRILDQEGLRYRFILTSDETESPFMVENTPYTTGRRLNSRTDERQTLLFPEYVRLNKYTAWVDNSILDLPDCDKDDGVRIFLTEEMATLMDSDSKSAYELHDQVKDIRVPVNLNLDSDVLASAEKVSEVEIVRPPLDAEFLLHLIFRKSEEAEIGDFIERYSTKRKRFGKRRADIWAYREVLRNILPALKKGIAALTGIVAAAEWVKRHLY